MYEEKDREVRLGSLHDMRPSNAESPSYSISLQQSDAPTLAGYTEPYLLPIRLSGAHSASRPASSLQTPGPRQLGLPPRPREIALVERPRPKPAQAPDSKPQSAAREQEAGRIDDCARPALPGSPSSDFDGCPAGDGSPIHLPHVDGLDEHGSWGGPGDGPGEPMPASGMSSNVTRADTAVDLASSREPPFAAEEALAPPSPSMSATDEDLEAMPFLVHEDHDADLDALEESASLLHGDLHASAGHASPYATAYRDPGRPDAPAEAPAACRAGAACDAALLRGAAEPPSLQMSMGSADEVEACCSASRHDAAAGAARSVTSGLLNTRDPAGSPLGTGGEEPATHSGMDSNFDGSLGSDHGPGFPFFAGAGDLVSVMPDESDVLGFSPGPALGWQASPHAASGELWSPNLSGNSDSLGPTAGAFSDDGRAHAGPSLRLYSSRCESPQGGLWQLDGSGSSGDPSVRGFGGGSGLHLKQALHVQGVRGSNPLAGSLPSASVSASSDEGSLGTFTGQPMWAGAHDRTSQPPPAGRGVSGGKPVARTAYREEPLGHEHAS